MVAVRMAVSVLVTWVALIVLFVAPAAALPEDWRYVVYSPAGVGLWMLAVLVAPVVVCFAKWPWIRSGGG